MNHDPYRVSLFSEKWAATLIYLLMILGFFLMLAWFVFSFINASFNPMDWSAEVRGGMMAAWLIPAGLAAFGTLIARHA